VISTWGGGKFHNVFGEQATKWPIEKKRKKKRRKKPLKHLCFGMHHN
jgi:hypothetical protein